jgi:single-stranded-DNA-specific exonuclease
LLVQVLAGLGADVRAYIPHRVDEGYGLNLDALRRLYSDGIRLVVTVDCGIRALEEIGHARRGIEFIVTDHHSVGPQLPRASAVINPKRGDSAYPFRDLSGVGVAYKVAQALLHEAAGLQMSGDQPLVSLLDLVALGSVADMVPLRGENRQLVRFGLEVLKRAERPGVRALVEKAGVAAPEIDAEAISFRLAPRLNAAGRLGDAELAYQLLRTTDHKRADLLASRLNSRNQRRQQLTAEAYQRAEQLALSRGQDLSILFAAEPSFHPGIVGLVAGRLSEAYYRPSIVVEEGDPICRGSCRSVPEFDITRALDQCADLLIRHGGHASAAGFTAHKDQLEALMERLFVLADEAFAGRDLTPTLDIDLEVPVADMDWTASEWLQRLEPCGQENPKALFLSRAVPLAEIRTVGEQDRHLKLVLDGGSPVTDVIGFGLGERSSELGLRADLVYRLELNRWNGSTRLQLNLQDIRPA